MAHLHDTTEQPARLSITDSTTAGVRVLTLSGEIDADNIHLLRQALTCVDAGARMVLDLGAVTFMDSSAISVLAVAHRGVAGADGWLRMAALSAPVERVVTIVGLDTIIPCYPTLPDALADAV
ncbi:STAS domain-containing protein [Streptomyces sp. NPDC001910]|uniref:STAS domain-containing protein n=1 Tax=Streptomyces sp. NPDC001910 TaxID=3154403 RepID=UPI00332B4664